MTRRSLLRRLGLVTGAVVCAPLLPFTQAEVGLTPAMATAIAAQSTMFSPTLGIALRYIETYDRPYDRPWVSRAPIRLMAEDCT